ncbi:MAG: signal recognition particle protein [Holosporaceae bacterium]
MFQNLKGRLSDIFQNLKGKGVLKEADLDAALREIRIALLEADVALAVIKPFLENIKKEALGQKVTESLSASQMVVKIVYDELVKLLQASEGAHDINLAARAPVVVLVVGLQGSGKTTLTGKLAHYLKKTKNKKVHVASVDVYRPAAREQLAQLATQADVYSLPIQDQKPKQIAKAALAEAQTDGADVLLVDTAGRLQIDDALMQELEMLKAQLNPTEILFVGDAMMGQEALHVAEAFHARLGITGSALTRLDGDARGGAALSITKATGTPLKFLGVGEHIKDLEAFDPERHAKRILDMGDVLGLVEEVEQHLDKKELEQTAQRMQKGLFTLSDMEKQLSQMGRLGSFEKLLGFIPGMGGMLSKMPQLDDAQAKKALTQKLAIIRSMTPRERLWPKLLNASRKRRIALGSGTDVPAVNRLLKEFAQMGKMLKRMGKLNKKGLGKKMMSQEMMAAMSQGGGQPPLPGGMKPPRPF